MSDAIIDASATSSAINAAFNLTDVLYRDFSVFLISCSFFATSSLPRACSIDIRRSISRMVLSNQTFLLQWCSKVF